MTLNRLTTCILLCISLGINAQTRNIALIPKPNKIILLQDHFSLVNNMPLYIHEEFQIVSELLHDNPMLNIGTTEVVKKLKKNHNTGFRIFKAIDTDNLPKESFKLVIDESGILIKAHAPQQAILAISTLHQLCLLQKDHTLPYVTIEDKPRFAYRGLHLDVSRHFMPFDFLKKYIDIMALYKFNYFHWHLTDGAGWRLEIKQYPELTTKAAWRPYVNFTDWDANGKLYVDQDHPNAYGGFYTQEQARELVAYAARKGITIIPEIEMPGHSEEVLAVYPELSCTGKPHTQNEFCLGNDNTYEFLKNVLNEVLEIFPSQYIHIGGDEANKTHWKNCSKCQKLKEEKGLKDENALQSFAIQQMDEYLQSKGRKMIGWDEILEGGLTKGATVMSWQGESGGIKAANMGHDVIMSPTSHLYFDFYQFDPRTQPTAFGGYLPLDKVYSYNPVPKEVNNDKTKHIIGAQANVWTEHMPTPQQVEYMTFPRALALSEVNWTNQDLRDFSDFKSRLQAHYHILQQMDINYYRPSFHITHQVNFDPVKQTNRVYLDTEQYNPTIRYTTDGSEPTNTSTLYNLPIDLSSTTTLKAASFLDSSRIGQVSTIQLDVHKAIGKTVIYNTKWEKYEAEKEKTLTNGKKGGISYHDGQWQGFTNDMDIIIDMDRREEIKSIAADFLQVPQPGVYFPGEFKILVSDNGKNYREVGSVVNHDDPHTPVLKSKTFKVELEKPTMTRYIRIVATNKMSGFLFVDEIVVY